MGICVIFNPTARGDKARRRLEQLQQVAGQSEFRATSGPGTAKELAAAAVAEGFESIVAAGGDGTIHEVMNGIASAREGLSRSRLGVLPLGTVNVFAQEIGLPLSLESAWKVVVAGREKSVDLPKVEFESGAGRSSRFFVQLAGVGLDARAVHLVSWELKKRLGAAAYVAAGLRVMREPHGRVEVESNGRRSEGELVLIGNGRYYGGRLPLFRMADLHDGKLDICVFPKVNWLRLMRYIWSMVAQRTASGDLQDHFQSDRVRVSGGGSMVEVDGEWAGHAPAEFRIGSERLRVIVPKG